MKRLEKGLIILVRDEKEEHTYHVEEGSGGKGWPEGTIFHPLELEQLASYGFSQQYVAKKEEEFKKKYKESNVEIKKRLLTFFNEKLK